MNSEGELILRQKLVSGPIVFIDGECHLCHGFVRFVLRREASSSHKTVTFASIQDFMGELKSMFPGQFSSGSLIESQVLKSILVVGLDAQGHAQLFSKTTGVLHVFKLLRFPWNWLEKIVRGLPLWLLNFVYDGVAATRYRLFGKMEQCYWESGLPRDRILIRSSSSRTI